MRAMPPTNPSGNPQSLETPRFSLDVQADHPLQAAGIPKVSSAELETDPHAVFRRLRSKTPVVQREDGACLILRAGDVEQLLTDPRTQQIAGAHYAALRGVPPGPLFDVLAGSLLMSNGEEHRRRRAPMARGLAFRAMEMLRPLVRSAAESIIDRFEGRRAADLVSDFAAPFPPLVLSHLLGVPPADAPAFANAVYDVSPAFAAARPEEDMAKMVRGASWLTEYVEHRLTQAAAAPGSGGVLGAVLEASGRELSPAEVTAQLVTLLIAGSDTTRTAMAVQVGLLLSHDVRWAALGEDQTLARAAVAEALRYEPAVGSVPRFSLEDIELDGVVVPAGRLVSLSTLSAMRDPARFATPDAFLLGRIDHPRWHMVFGGGPHRCLGEALGRLELEEGLMALSRRLPHLCLSGAPPLVQGYAGIRRIADLPVRW